MQMLNIDIVAIDGQIRNIKDNFNQNIGIIKDQLNKLEDEINKSKYLLQRPMQISLAGRISTGKSSFLNKLFGCDLLPVSFGQTTKCCTEIRVHDKDDITVDVIYKDKSSESKSFSSLDGLHNHLCGIYDKASCTDKVTISLSENGDKYPWLTNLIVVDTPGLGYSNALNDVILDQCSQSDVIIVAVNASSCIGVEEWNFIRALSHKRSIAKFVFLFTFTDELSDKDMDQVKVHHKYEAVEIIKESGLSALPIEMYFEEKDPIQIIQETVASINSTNLNFEQITKAIQKEYFVTPDVTESINFDVTNPVVESLYENICFSFQYGNNDEKSSLKNILRDQQQWAELLDWYVEEERELGFSYKDVKYFIFETSIWDKFYLVRQFFVTIFKLLDYISAEPPHILFRSVRQRIDYHSVSGVELDFGDLNEAYVNAAKWNISEIILKCSIADLRINTFKMHYIGIQKTLKDIVWCQDVKSTVPKIKRFVFFTSVVIGNCKIKNTNITHDRDLLRAAITYYRSRKDCKNISEHLAQLLIGDFSKVDELISSYEEACSTDKTTIGRQCFLIFTEIFMIYLYTEALRTFYPWKNPDQLDPIVKLIKTIKYSRH